MDRPPAGLTTTAAWVANRDGDTVVLMLPMLGECAVRLADCWCAELSTPEGRKAKEALDALFEQRAGEPVNVHFELPRDRNEDGRISLVEFLKSEVTFDRLVGHVWIGDDDVGEWMVACGHATTEKV